MLPSWDKSTWGIALAIAAIILTIPLTIIGNLITSAIRNWWAERSSPAKLAVRISFLEYEFDRLMHEPALSDAEQQILVALGVLGFLVTLIVLGLPVETVRLERMLARVPNYPASALPPVANGNIPAIVGAVILNVLVYAFAYYFCMYRPLFLVWKRSNTRVRFLESNLKKLKRKYREVTGHDL